MFVLISKCRDAQFANNENSPQSELFSLISDDLNDYIQIRKLLEPGSPLIDKNIIKINVNYMFGMTYYSIGDALYKELTNDADPANSNQNTGLRFSDGDYFRLLQPRQTIDMLILPDDIKSTLSSSVRLHNEPQRYNLANWGLTSLKTDKSNDNENSKGMTFLFHGHSGTGKTYAAGALANALHKSLFNIEATNLRDKYYGESQRIVKDAFRLMRKTISESSNPPVFLLNECDQLIHMRLDLGSSCTETENAIQNIILEELETFPGIFIATTNLVENLDTAFFRRFNYKIQFPLPDEECRYQLWLLHIPTQVPGYDTLDLHKLARCYPLTGGQIRLIVENACAEAITRDTQQCLTQQDLIKYTELELGKTDEAKPKVCGFR